MYYVIYIINHFVIFKKKGQILYIKFKYENYTNEDYLLFIFVFY